MGLLFLKASLTPQVGGFLTQVLEVLKAVQNAGLLCQKDMNFFGNCLPQNTGCSKAASLVPSRTL